MPTGRPSSASRGPPSTGSTRSSPSAGSAARTPSSSPRTAARSSDSSRDSSSTVRLGSGMCTSSRWTPAIGGTATHGPSSGRPSAASRPGRRLALSPRSPTTTTRLAASSSPSASRRSRGPPSGSGTAGGGSGSRCGWSSPPTRSSWRVLSRTPPRRPLKRPLVPRRTGETATHGWIIDAYGDLDRDAMVLWLWNEQGAHRIEDPRFLPTFFLHVPPSELTAIQRRIEILDGVREIREVARRIALEDDEPRPVLEIVPRHYRDLRTLARILDSNGGYVDHRLFNVDLRFSQRYMMEHGIFPMGLVRYTNGRWAPEEEHFALDYTLPPLRKSLLDLHVANPMGIPRMTDRLLGARVDNDEIDGDEESILRGIGELVRSRDPDVLLTDGGDAFTVPYLARKAAELRVDLQLGRDRDRFAERKGKSYFTYGKIVYKPGQYILRGRLHLDRGHFAMRESALAGLAELSRLSTLTPQEQARLTPGPATPAMQETQAPRAGSLILGKKTRRENLKSTGPPSRWAWFT